MATTLKNYLTVNIGTSPTTVYNPTTVGIQTTVIGMSVANTTTSDITINIALVSGGTTAYLVKNLELPVGNTYNVTGDIKLVLERNDSLQVTSSTASSADVVVSAVEVV